MGFSWKPPASLEAASDTVTSAVAVSGAVVSLVVALLAALLPQPVKIASIMTAARASAKGFFFMINFLLHEIYKLFYFKPLIAA
jgi:hypothetical protein